MRVNRTWSVILLCLGPLFPLLAAQAWPQAGTASEPVRYTGKERPDNSYQDGRLRPAVGVEQLQGR